MADLAPFYAAQPARARPGTTDAAAVRRGAALAEQHHCTSCTGPGSRPAAGRAPGRQDFAYLLRLLRAFKARTRLGLDGR